ncbi:hypothetical protein SALBM135S_06759 [Streptomyces alboniger]
MAPSPPDSSSSGLRQADAARHRDGRQRLGEHGSLLCYNDGKELKQSQLKSCLQDKDVKSIKVDPDEKVRFGVDPEIAEKGWTLLMNGRPLAAGRLVGVAALLQHRRDVLQECRQVLDDRGQFVRLAALRGGHGRRRVENRHGQGLVSALTGDDSELHALSRLECVDAGGQYGGVHEDIAAVVAGEEAEALLAVEPLDLAGRHVKSSSSYSSYFVYAGPPGREGRGENGSG